MEADGRFIRVGEAAQIEAQQIAAAQKTVRTDGKDDVAVLAALHRAQQYQRTSQRNDVGDEAACQRFDGAAHRQRYEQEHDLHGEKEEELFQVFLPDLVPAVPVDIRHRAAIKQEIAQFFHWPFLLSVRFRSFLCTLTSYCITQKKEMEVFILLFYSAAWYACR